MQALWCDPDEEDAVPAWYWCTIVTFRPGRRVKYNYIMHFDDGTAEKIALPDEEGTIEIRDDAVEMCTCDRSLPLRWLRGGEASDPRHRPVELCSVYCFSLVYVCDAYCFIIHYIYTTV